MDIPESLVWALDNNGTSVVKIYCAENIRKEIASRYTEVFNDEYEKLMDLVEEEQGTCFERVEGINPFNGPRVTDYGVLLRFNELALYSGKYGDYISGYFAEVAVEKALDIIENEYPSIVYDGYIAYSMADIHGGEIVQFRISSGMNRDKDDEVYDCVGEVIGEAIMNEKTWLRLSDELIAEKEIEFKRIIKFFYLYSRWIPSWAIDRVIELSENNRWDIKESLQEFAAALRAGEVVDIEEDKIDTRRLPDGYMEVLDMFALAEEINGKNFDRSRVISSEGTFEIVIEKAESGDARAKFTAGKYFIADHIEEETDRALKWIHEAAEAGVEEAKEYLEEHNELFE